MSSRRGAESAEEEGSARSSQLLTYLRILDMRVGLLVNFNVELLKDGISRVVNQLPQ
jgi:GxxExxY protein